MESEQWPASEGEAREWLRDHGATDDQLASAHNTDELVRLATDMVIDRDAHLSAADIGARVGVHPNRVVALYRGLGVVVPSIDEVMFTELDVLSVEGWEAVSVVDSPDGQALMRAVAGSMDRIAEAGVALYVQSSEERLAREVGLVNCLPWMEEAVKMTEAARGLGESLGVLFLHHLRQAVQRQRISQLSVTSRDVAWQAVGFVDLVGSTALAEKLDVSELRVVVNEFEAQAFKVAADHGGRVVKFIGDEIMVAALDPATGCRLLLALVENCSTGEQRPRGGMSWGEVLFRGGDYHGREINLASRLVDAAIPGEVLVDASVVEAGAVGPDFDHGLVFEPAGRRLLKGFADPIPVWSVTQP